MIHNILSKKPKQDLYQFHISIHPVIKLALDLLWEDKDQLETSQTKIQNIYTTMKQRIRKFKQRKLENVK